MIKNIINSNSNLTEIILDILEKKLPTRVYLGGAIDFADSNTLEERKRIMGMISTNGYNVYNPATTFGIAYNQTDAGEFVKTINDFAMSQCDIVLLVFSKTILSVGTAAEMQVARDYGKKLIVVAPWDKCPLYVEALADNIFANVDDAINYLSGLKKPI